MEIAAPYLMFLGDVPDAARGEDGARHRRLAAGMVPRPAAPAGLPGRSRHPRPDRRRGGGARREDHGGRRRQRRRRAAGPLGAGDRRGDRGRDGRRERAARPARLDTPAIREAAERHGRRLFDVRHSDQTLRHRQGHEALGAAAAHGRHGLLGRARSTRRSRSSARCGRAASTPISAPPARPASSSPAAASRSTRWSPTSSPARSSGCRPAADDGPLGPRRGPGLALPPLLRRRLARPPARRAARRLRRLPRADPHRPCAASGTRCRRSPT